MEIEEVPLAQLIADPKNARVHSARNLEAIVHSLHRFGQVKPIVTTWEYVIAAGNGTFEAAKALGWETLVVNRLPIDWSLDQVRAYALADNQTAILAEWDEQILKDSLYELDAEGWDITELGFDQLTPPGMLLGDPDDVPDIPNEPVSKRGDVWILGEHRVMCGDATVKDDYVRLMAESVPEMVFADPPYGIQQTGKGITAGGVKGSVLGEIKGDDSVAVAVCSFGLLSNVYPDAVHIWWGANYYPSVLPNGHGWLVWDKERTGDVFSGAELAFVNGGVRVDVFRHMWHGMVKASEHEKRVHPTQKPVALVEWCTRRHEPRTVLDPFGGSGSTLIACEQTGRKCRMMEIDPRYVDVIVKRWENLTGKKAVLESSPNAEQANGGDERAD